MAVTYSPSGVPIARRPFPGTATLAHMAAGFFALTLLTDLAYLNTMIVMWQDFSSWLLFFGMVTAGLAFVVWLISVVGKGMRPVWASVMVQAVVLVVAFVNNLVHAGDGWTAIMPWGVGLSALTCLLMLIAAWLNRSAIVRA